MVTRAQDGQNKLPMQGVAQPTREEVLSLPRVHISTHPVMAHKMTTLRDKNTQPPEFYRLDERDWGTAGLRGYSSSGAEGSSH